VCTACLCVSVHARICMPKARVCVRWLTLDRQAWWDMEGMQKPLHSFNTLRIPFLCAPVPSPSCTHTSLPSSSCVAQLSLSLLLPILSIRGLRPPSPREPGPSLDPKSPTRQPQNPPPQHPTQPINDGTASKQSPGRRAAQSRGARGPQRPAHRRCWVWRRHPC